MKRFLIKLAVLALIMAMIFSGYNALYQRICNTDSAEKLEDKFRDVPDGIQICNFGSSHGRGFDYRNWQDEFTTFNFALNMQTLSYDYLILQQYVGNLAEGGVAFIPVSYFSFGWDEEGMDDFRSKNERYYPFLQPEYVKEYSWITDIGIRHFQPLLYNPSDVLRNIRNSLSKRALSAWEEDTEEEAILLQTYDTKKEEIPVQTEDTAEQEVPAQTDSEEFDFQRHADEKYRSHHIVDKNGDLVVLEEELNALHGMIRLCREHGIRPILITVPFRWEYNEEFDEKFYGQLHEVIDKVCEDESVEYYDYSHDERFIDSADYFRNSDHLSPKGAVVFTDLMINTYVK